MNILHYSLGFPPYRGGGMTKYCMDLITEQINRGHDVALLWPGTVFSWNGKISIKKNIPFSISQNMRCGSYEIMNPLPVPLLDGISDIKPFVSQKDKAAFEKFFKLTKVKVFHVHTLMGLPIEALQVAKKLNVKLIFTPHDYFGICPRGSLFRAGNICTDYEMCTSCAECNKGALSLKKIKMLQSTIYRKLKDTNVVSNLRKNHRSDSAIRDNGKIFTQNIIDDNSAEEYLNLRDYYCDMISMFDVIHYNSSLTMNVYSKFVDVSSAGKMIPISHSSIIDGRHIKVNHTPIHFSYLGPCEDKRKGFNILVQALDKLYLLYKDKFVLNVYGLCSYEAPYLRKNESYQYSQLEQIMDNTDLLIVPSIWMETFGFTVLEAISYGVPVLISDHVGAQDIIENRKSGIICSPNAEDLGKQLEMIIRDNGEILQLMNKYIVNNVSITTMKEHAEQIEQNCY